MKLFAGTLLALTLVCAAGAARAEDTGSKIEGGAKQTGKTLDRGGTAVGKGAKKIFHDAAHGFHKVVAKNSHSKHAKRVHLRKAAKHYKQADRNAKAADKAIDRAGQHADKVVK